MTGPRYDQHSAILSGRNALDRPRLDSIVLTRAGLAAWVDVRGTSDNYVTCVLTTGTPGRVRWVRIRWADVQAVRTPGALLEAPSTADGPWRLTTPTLTPEEPPEPSTAELDFRAWLQEVA